MSRVYDNWERLVGEVLKREQFREMALAPPSAESSFRSRRSDSDLSSFASSSNHHDELVDDEPLPGIYSLQISGEAFLGSQLLACGYSINGTTLGIFQWVRHFEDGSFEYIDGATEPNYTITIYDVDTYLAVEVQPLGDRKPMGELVKVFANEHKKITCHSQMQTCIANTYYSGHASYEVSLLTEYFIWQPAMLAIERNGYTIKCRQPSSVIVTSKFSSSTIVSISSGSPTRFSIVDPQGNKRKLKVDDNSLINNSRDTIVLTLRLFIKIKSGQKKRGLFFNKFAKYRNHVR